MMIDDTPENAPPYQNLTPESILQAVESVGYRCDARMLALNSYENRVYQVGLEESEPVVVKFYRPGRWSDEAILEEHAYTRELADQEIPTVPPLPNREGRTLHRYQGFRFTVFPRRGGRWPELDNPDNLAWLGRFLGRIHAVGGTRPFTHRPRLDIEGFGTRSYRFLLAHNFIPHDLTTAYSGLVEDVLQRVAYAYARAGEVRDIRLHGDCHPGNILWTDAGPHFVDFDDCRMGPAIQDLWMLLSGDRTAMTSQLEHILDGYGRFYDFDPRELYLLEALRTLRMIHHSAWLARRWHDPAFPRAFPWFNTQRYWEEQILGLREQAALLDEPPLMLA